MRVQCRTGGEAIYISPFDQNQNVHDAMDAAGCTHCADGRNEDPGHSCGMHLNQDECMAANHPDTPCWNPPEVPDRPHGCTVCRPLLIEPMGAVAPARVI